MALIKIMKMRGMSEGIGLREKIENSILVMVPLRHFVRCPSKTAKWAVGHKRRCQNGNTIGHHQQLGGIKLMGIDNSIFY